MQSEKGAKNYSVLYDHETEMAVLGEILIDQTAASIAFGMLDLFCFDGKNNQIIFKAGASLFKRGAPIDIITINDELVKTGQLEKLDDDRYLYDILQRTVSAANIEQHCKILIDYAASRKLFIFAENMQALIMEQPNRPDIDAIRQRLDDIAGGLAPIGEAPTVASRLRDKQERDAWREPGELLGYHLKNLDKIGAAIDGIQPGFYIFAGITHVGKTAFLTNIFLDLLDANPDLCGVYFSLDDNENIIFNRLLAILCNGTLTINQLQRRVADEMKSAHLAAAYLDLIRLAESGRFNIMDFSQIRTIEAVEAIIRAYQRQGKKLFIVIDGLQNIDTGKEYGGLREKNVDLAAGVKRLVDVYQIPLFTSVELRKRTGREPADMPVLDDIMESGKYAYNASHIWIAHPDKDFDNFINHQQDSYKLTIRTAKSKLSGSVGDMEINLERSHNRITFPAQTSSGAAITSRERIE